MKRVIIMGSPRSNGRSAHLAEMLFEANIDERPEDELFLVPVSEVEIGPCIGCNACRKKAAVTFKGDDGVEVTVLRNRCIFDDDMQTLYDLLDEADELTVVSPVYFSGAPASMKCVLDRLQPYFWVTQVRGREMAEEDADEPLDGADGAVALGQDAEHKRRIATKRPATLHIVGEGGDPHGFMPLVSEVKSSLACAGFRLEHVFDWVGKIDCAGEILAEATEVVLPAAGVMGSAPETVLDDAPKSSDRESASRPRPKLDLGSSPRKNQGKGASSGKARNAGSGKQQGQKRPNGQGAQKGKPSSHRAKGKGGGSRG